MIFFSDSRGHWYRPDFILRFLDGLLKWLPLPFGGLACVGLIWVFYFSPADYQQGETVRLMYVHVPASWGALAIYFVMAFFSALEMIKKNPFFSCVVRAMAPVGLGLCMVSLITGACWGKPTWGAWWVWDARLTSMLILALLYLAYLFIVESCVVPPAGAGFLPLLGAIHLPIIKWSVTWWSTLHQPASLMKLGKPSIHWSILAPLLWMTAVFILGAIFLFSFRLRAEFIKRRLYRLQMEEER